MVSAYLVGTASVSFWILVPIAYLLILSAGLLIVSRHYRNIFLAVCALFVACALLFEWEGIRSGYLQILGIGMLGISVGYIPIERINGILKRRLAILLAYSAYLLAITLWNDPYPLQIVGVCLSLAIIYWMGMGGSRRKIPQGRYSARAVFVVRVYRSDRDPPNAAAGPASPWQRDRRIVRSIPSVRRLHDPECRSFGSGENQDEWSE